MALRDETLCAVNRNADGGQAETKDLNVAQETVLHKLQRARRPQLYFTIPVRVVHINIRRNKCRVCCRTGHA